MEALPPLDRPLAWVVVRGYEQAGPYALNVLIEEVVAGRLATTTPVWWPPLSDWTTIMGSDSLMAEIDRRRSGGAPGWAPPAAVNGADDVPAGVGVTDGTGVTDQTLETDEAAGMDQLLADTDTAGTAADVEVVDPEAIELEPSSDVDPVDDDGIVDAVITVPPSSIDPVDETFVALVERSSGLAAVLAALAAVDETFVSALTIAADARGLGTTDRHSGVDEHRVHMRDLSGDNELTVLLGRVTSGPTETSIRSVVPLSMVLTTRGVVGATESSRLRQDSGSAHGAVDVAFDGRSGRTAASVELYLGVADYVDANLVVASERLHLDLGSVIDSLGSAMGR